MYSRTPSRLPLMFGLPDDHMVRLVSVANGGQIDVPGAATFLPHLSPQHASRLDTVFFGPGISVQPTPGMLGLPVVNNVVDPDISSASLRILATMLTSMRSPCFNHPAAILETGRDRVAEKLDAIAGVEAPKTLRARIDEPSDIQSVMRQHGFHFPILLRIAGTHGGLALVRADSTDEIKTALSSIPWGGRELYISQFVEYADNDLLYRKMRIVVVGSGIFLRHSIATHEWQVHAQKRSEAALIVEERMLETFDETILPAIRGRILAIANALDLDYFGIDCCLRADGSLLVFEANAAMNVLLNQFPSPNCWDRPVQRIHDALADLLFNPGHWRRQGAAS